MKPLYVVRMNTYVYDREYPISMSFFSLRKAQSYIKQALAIYPYVKLTLHKQHLNGESEFVGTYEAF